MLRSPMLILVAVPPGSDYLELTVCQRLTRVYTKIYRAQQSSPTEPTIWAGRSRISGDAPSTYSLT